MTESLFSPGWHRVAGLKPRLKRHAEVRRQSYRGEIWYVVYDPLSAKTHRLSIAAYTLITGLDGRTTVDEQWRSIADELGDELPSQDEVIRLLSTLYRADLLVTDRMPDLDEARQRYRDELKRDRLKKYLNPMFLRIRLFDPERLLRALQPLAPVLFSKGMLLFWLILASSAAVQLGINWREFTEGISDRVFSADNALIMLLVFPLLKACHELAHGLAVKRWGGEVHDIGIMFLVFFPVPYVDASSSWSFRDKHHRMLVGAAGMLAEVLIASVAMLLWTVTEPGLGRSILYNIVLIAGLTTVAFNANPLLRFDGYFILMDWLEIPNLGARANRYMQYLAKRYILNLPLEDASWGSTRERIWLLCYAVGSFVYRLMLTLTIAVFVAGQFFVLGVLLAIWALTMSLVLPLGKLLRYLFWDAELRLYRGRALRVSGLMAGALAACLFIVPLPYMSVHEGVVWIPEESHLRAPEGGFVASQQLGSGQPVLAGETILTLEDPELETRIIAATHRLNAYRHNYRALRGEDSVEAEVVMDEIRALERDIETLQSKLASLALVSPSSGRLVIPDEQDLAGRYVVKGEQLGYVVSDEATVVRVAVPQPGVGLVREQVRDVAARFAHDLHRVYPATVIREVPGATNDLPSLALTREGGGRLASATDQDGRPGSFEQVFLFDILVPPRADSAWSGERVFVRFNHGFASLWVQTSQALRHLFLRLADF